ncbi:MAG: YajD family HNH nuclease [Candidatus Competibacteraceae bacterium]|nr:YajD family HNH nuclease [Candidatus Competibacteraceae bacterium]
MPPSKTPDRDRLDRVVAQAQRDRRQRQQGYREQALRILPWVCGRCAREFTRDNLQQLTVHHRDHDHDHNPPDGSNWELLCRDCHDNEHARLTDAAGLAPDQPRGPEQPTARHQPFANLKDLLKPDR